MIWVLLAALALLLAGHVWLIRSARKFNPGARCPDIQEKAAFCLSGEEKSRREELPEVDSSLYTAMSRSYVARQNLDDETGSPDQTETE